MGRPDGGPVGAGFDAMMNRLAKQPSVIGVNLVGRGELPKASGQLIGSCGIRQASAGAREADIGYELSPDHWGHGYATEAARAIVQFGFAELRLHRIWAWCIADNAASARVLNKIGMKLEGRLRRKEYFKGRWWDTLMYGMLDNAWHG